MPSKNAALAKAENGKTHFGSCSPTSVCTMVFICALAIRCCYALTLFLALGDGGLKGVDSVVFAANAEVFAAAVRSGTVHGFHWLGDASNTMPLFQWLIMLPYLIFGSGGALAYVLLQCVFDSATCVLVYAIARSLDPRLALPAAVIATINPTQIVMSGLIYTDTPYTFFITLSLYCALRWTHAPTWRNAGLLGCAQAAAALIRVSIAPWVLSATALLFIYALLKRKPFRQWTTLIYSTIILGICLAVISGRSFNQYGTYALSPQGGEHFALWIIPLAKEAQDRTPFATSVETIVKRVTERYGPPSPDPFEQSRRYGQIGREALQNEIALPSLLASWASGILINLASPALLLSPPVTQLPRTGFYDTPGASFAHKVFNYAFYSGNATYSWLLILGTLGLAIVRLIQIASVIALIRQSKYWPKIIFGGSLMLYLLALNGPIASPKYRLPLEPLFNIMTAAGLLSFQRYATFWWFDVDRNIA